MLKDDAGIGRGVECPTVYNILFRRRCETGVTCQATSESLL